MKESNLKWKAVVCAVIFILVSVSVAPSIYADMDIVSIDTTPDTDIYDYDGYTPIKLVFLLISKLINHEEIQTIESVDDVEQIVEHDAELSGIFEELMSSSCGCEDSSSLEWNFPVICGLMFPVYCFLLFFGGSWLDPIWYILVFIGESLNCWWVHLPAS